MEKLTLKYALMVGGILFSFTNFIACGAQMYQVSLRDDHDEAKVPQHAYNPTSQFFGIHSAAGWSELPIPFKVSRALNAEQEKGLRNAMATWEKAVGKKLFDYQGTDDKVGDSFMDLYSSLRDEVNGYYLDNNWTKTGKSSFVLATTIWDNAHHNNEEIRTADVRFNANHYLIGDSYYLTRTAGDEREVVDMETLALHELGHLLGLAHVSAETDKGSIMKPSIFIGEGLANRRLSLGDIQRIQQIYGCSGEACDSEELAAVMSASPAGGGEGAKTAYSNSP